MNFLFHVHGYKPAYNYGGPIYSVSGLAEGLVKRGHHVFVATGNRNLREMLDVDPGRVYDRDGVQVRYFPTRLNYLQGLGLPYFSKSAMFQFDDSFPDWLSEKGEGFDLFHTQMAFIPGSGVFSRTAKRCRKPFLYHQRGNLDPVRLRFRSLKKRCYLHFVEKPVMRRADLLMALSEYETASYRALGLENRVEVLPNGIESNFADSDGGASPGSVLDRVLKEAGDQLLFLFLGRIHPMKGPGLFVEAFIEFARTHPKGVGVLAGPDEFGQVAGFEAQIRKLGLAERFFFTGFISGGDKIRLLKRADALVLPSYSEGSSIVLLEALACGCPVITTPGAHFDDIEKAGAGVIVEASAPGVLGGLGKLARNGGEALREMGAKGRELVEERYTWPRIVARYEALALELHEQRERNPNPRQDRR